MSIDFRPTSHAMSFSHRLSSRAALAATLSATLLLAGCATPGRGGYDYTASEARRPMLVTLGTLESVRDVRLEQDRQTGVGTAAGAVVGGIAGSTIGGGRGQAIATVLGAVAGGLGGSQIERGTGARQGVELTVRTDDGRTLAIVQEAGNERYTPGQRVRVLTDTARGTMRVSQ